MSYTPIPKFLIRLSGPSHQVEHHVQLAAPSEFKSGRRREHVRGERVQVARVGGTWGLHRRRFGVGILIYADERANTQIGDGTRTGEDFTVHFGELMYAWAGTLVI